MAKLEFFFDVSSPWTYLAFHAVQPLADECGAELVWKPILVGGVFNTVNPSVYQSRQAPVPAKAAYMLKDLQDWARLYDLKIVFPPPVFPVNSVKAMRGCYVALDQGRLPQFARRLFEAYWGELQDISQDEVLAEVAGQSGLDGAALLAAIADPAVKQRLKDGTDELISRGGFGSPTLYVDGNDMYFGNDRLDLVRRALLGKG